MTITGEYPSRVHRAYLTEIVILGAAFAAAAKFYLFDSYLNHDSVWLVVAAERMLDGGDYLRDFFEVNPPLAILLHAPAIGIAKLTGLDPFSSYTLQVLLAVFAIWVLLRLVMKGHFPERVALGWRRPRPAGPRDSPACDCCPAMWRPSDYLAFFGAGERFALLCLNYEYVDSADGMDVYLRRDRPDQAGPDR